MTELEAHPITEIFPLMQGEEFDQLVEDIREYGLQEPIWLHPDGRIIDGRNRYEACLEAQIEPRRRTWSGEGSLVSFVASLNLHRRHLTSSQRAAAAAEAFDQLKAEAEERQREGGRKGRKKKVPQNFGEPSEPEPDRHAGEAIQQAAELFGTNRAYVAEAVRAKGKTPDLYEAVKAGHLNLNQQSEIQECLRLDPALWKRVTARADPKDWVLLLNLWKRAERLYFSSAKSSACLARALDASEADDSVALQQAAKQVREEIKAEERARKRRREESERRRTEMEEEEWQEREPFDYFAEFLLENFLGIRGDRNYGVLLRHLSNCGLDQVRAAVEKLAAEQDAEIAEIEAAANG
jgi:hypothetical protein